MASDYELIHYIKHYLIYVGFVPSFKEIQYVLGIDNVRERMDRLEEQGVIKYINPISSPTGDCYKVIEER